MGMAQSPLPISELEQLPEVLYKLHPELLLLAMDSDAELDVLRQVSGHLDVLSRVRLPELHVDVSIQ